MQFRWPPKPYFAFVASLLGFVVEQYVAGQEYWSQIPFGGIALLLLAFGIGLLVEDWRNEGSWLRQNFHEWFKVFEIEVVNTPTGSDKTHQWLKLRIRLRFLKDIKNAHIVITVRYGVNLSHVNHRIVLVDEQLGSISKDSTPEFTVATVPLRSFKKEESEGYSSWGSRYRKSGDVEGMHSLSDGTESVIEIRLKGYRQVEKVFVAFLKQNSDTFGRFHLSHTGKDSSTRIVV